MHMYIICLKEIKKKKKPKPHSLELDVFVKCLTATYTVNKYEGSIYIFCKRYLNIGNISRNASLILYYAYFVYIC